MFSKEGERRERNGQEREQKMDRKTKREQKVGRREEHKKKRGRVRGIPYATMLNVLQKTFSCSRTLTLVALV